MTITELQAAVERCEGFVPMSPSVTLLVKWAKMLLSTDPITPEWLREKWGFERIDVRYAKVLITDAIGVEQTLCWYGFNRFGVRGMAIDMNQGQFTALMFSLGHFPKETP